MFFPIIKSELIIFILQIYNISTKWQNLYYIIVPKMINYVLYKLEIN